MSNRNVLASATTSARIEPRVAHVGGAAATARGATQASIEPPRRLSLRMTILSWALQLATVGILVQTLFFKFTGAEESVYIFTTLGMEPWGRIGSGIAELIAALLLLAPRMAVPGGLLSLGVISGAIASHLTRLGIAVKGDGGLLFGLALTVFACSAGILLIRRSELKRWARTAAAYLRPVTGAPN